MSHSAGWSDPDDRSPQEDRDSEPRGFPPATSWVPPQEESDSVPSDGWGTPGPHLTGPIPRIRATRPPSEAAPATSAGAPSTLPAPTWAPELSTASPRGQSPGQPGSESERAAPPGQSSRQPASEPERAAPSAAAPAEAPREARERRGLGSLFDFGFRTRGTHALVPIVYGLTVTYAVLVFLLDLFAVSAGVGVGVIVLDLVRALLVGGLRFLLTLGVVRILCELALNLLTLMETQGRERQ